MFVSLIVSRLPCVHGSGSAERTFRCPLSQLIHCGRAYALHAVFDMEALLHVSSAGYARRCRWRCYCNMEPGSRETVAQMRPYNNGAGLTLRLVAMADTNLRAGRAPQQRAWGPQGEVQCPPELRLHPCCPPLWCSRALTHLSCVIQLRQTCAKEEALPAASAMSGAPHTDRVCELP